MDNKQTRFFIILAAAVFLMYVFAVPTLTNWLGPVAGSYASAASVTIIALLSYLVTKRVDKSTGA